MSHQVQDSDSAERSEDTSEAGVACCLHWHTNDAAPAAAGAKAAAAPAAGASKVNQFTGLIKNADGTRSFPDGSPVNGVNNLDSTLSFKGPMPAHDKSQNGSAMTHVDIV